MLGRGGRAGGRIVERIRGVLRLLAGLDGRHGLGAIDPGGVSQIAQECGAGGDTLVNQFPRFLIVLVLVAAAEIDAIDVLDEVARIERMLQGGFPRIVEVTRLFGNVGKDIGFGVEIRSTYSDSKRL